MNTLICFKSKYGATAKYADWLSSSLDAELKCYSEIGYKFDFQPYDLIVVMSGTYAGLMPLNRFLKGKWNKLKSKNIVAVAVGAAPADDKWSGWSYKRIPKNIREHIKYYKLMGEDPEQARPSNYVSKVKKVNLKPVLDYIKA